MIIDEKLMQPPPPPYYYSPPPAFSENAGGSSTGRNAAAEATFSSLPAHLLLQIVYSTFPQQDGRYEGESKIERQRRNLYWLETSLRLVNKSLYIACMHILRSTYLPAYDSLIRAPYTSDPFSSPANPTSSGSVRREIATLDLFIALLAHEDVLLDATSLHLPREEAYKDLFDMVQPRSRLEDLILEEGLRTGLVYVGNAPSESSATEPVVAAPIAMDLPAVVSVKTENIPPQPSPSPTKTSFNPFSRSSYISLAKSKMRRTNTPPGTPSPTSPVDTSTASSSPKLKSRLNPLPFESIGVSFSPRSVALIYMPAVSSNGANHGSTFGALSVSITGPTAAGGFKAKKTLVEVVRARDEQLEVSAKRLIQGLEEVMSAGGV